MTKLDVTGRAVGGKFSAGKRDLAATSRPQFNARGRHWGDRLFALRLLLGVSFLLTTATVGICPMTVFLSI